MSQAFSDVRIIDFTQVLAGPFATQQLALLGADVIKIEQPGVGDQTRGLMNESPDAAAGMSPSFLSCNMGKRSIVLNLKSAQAQTIVSRLVETADVVVENFRAGVMDKLGFGYSSLKALKPDLIYCAISGYGQKGPKSGVPAYDGAIQADSGMMAITGHPETGPTRTGYMPVDMATALTAAFAISAALYRKKSTGEGQFIDVAMMDTAVVLQTVQVSNYLINGKVPELLGNRSPTGQPTANAFKTADGHLNVLALREHQVSGLFDIIGRADANSAEQFATGPARVANYDACVELVQHELKKQSSAHWLEAFARGGVPAAAIRAYPEMLADEQFQHRNTFIEFPAPATGAGNAEGSVQLVRAAYETDKDGPQTAHPPPTLGEHTAQVLDEIGFSESEIEAFKNQAVI